MHLTETNGITKGRQLIAGEAAAIVNYYMAAGVLTHGAQFVSVDKYGLDATGFEASAQNDPADSYWFWNNDLWGNYLTFVSTMHKTTGLPVILWQLPVGHINTSQAADPYTGGLFPTLIDSNRQLEDSSPTFFLGDTFQPRAQGIPTLPRIWRVTRSDLERQHDHMGIAHAGCGGSGSGIGSVRRRGWCEHQRGRDCNGWLLVDQRGAGVLFAGCAAEVVGCKVG